MLDDLTLTLQMVIVSVEERASLSAAVHLAASSSSPTLVDDETLGTSCGLLDLAECGWKGRCWGASWGLASKERWFACP